jgi:hypothetical protein
VPDLENSERRLLRATYHPVHPQRRVSPKRALAKRYYAASLQITRDELRRLKRADIDAPAAKAIETVAVGNTPSSLPESAAIFAEVDWDSLISIGEALVELREQDLAAFREISPGILDAYERGEASRKAQALAPGDRLRSFSADDLVAALPAVSRFSTALEWAASGQFKARLADFDRSAVMRLELAHSSVAAAKQSVAIEPVGLLHLERLNFVPAGIERGELVHSVPLTPGEEVNIAHKEWSNTSEEFSRIVTDFMEAYSEEGVTEKSELTQSATAQEQHSSGLNTGVTASGGYGPVSISTSLAVNIADSSSQSEQTARNHSLTTTRKASARSKKEHKMSFKVASAAGTEDQQVRKIKNPFSDRATRVDYYQLVRKWRVDLCRYGLRLTYDVMIPEPGLGILSKIQEIQTLSEALEVPFGDPDAPEDSPAYFPSKLKDGTFEQQVEQLFSLAEQYGAAVDPPQLEQVKSAAINPGPIDDENANRKAFYSAAIEIPDGYFVTQAQVLQFDWDPTPGHEGDERLEIIAPFPPEPYVDKNSLPLELPNGGIGATPTSDWQGNPFELVVSARWVYTMEIIVQIKIKMTDDALGTWKAKAWQTIREAAETRYQEYRQTLKDKLARLQEELGGDDPLSLRKREREEVMKCVLRWLLGPSFTFAPPEVEAGFVPSEEAAFKPDPSPWGAMAALYWFMEWGEVSKQEDTIRFLQHAIEWENMLYFIYPYFWSHPDRWELKKYLHHPDLMHQAFLKSGSARVVLTIRPDFESAFVNFCETGKPEHAPYLSIAQEMEAYAQTNYPGIKAANPIEHPRPLLHPMQRRAWKEMQDIILVLDSYNDAQHKADPSLDSEVKVYPSTDEGLAALAPLVPLVENGETVVAELPLTDPWDYPYVYRCPGVHDDYDLVSYGADGAEGGEDDAEGEKADITSWAEANLIGRWYEYTPTSALDIAFDETSPEETAPTP